MPSPIVLLTDFGVTDPYVGQMHGVLAKMAPQAKVVDLCHSVQPQGLGQASFFLTSSYAYFPQGSIFVCVVDPGVGTARDILGIEADGKFILAPDNGLTAAIFERFVDARCWRMDTTPYLNASATFHGRDIFCPMAASLYNGASPTEMGIATPLTATHRPQWAAPSITNNSLTAQVLHIDHFGNIVLNLPESPWKKFFTGATLTLSNFPHSLRNVSTYMDLTPCTAGAIEPELGLLCGSQEHLEIACNGGSAAQHLGLSLGDSLTIIAQKDI